MKKTYISAKLKVIETNFQLSIMATSWSVDGNDKTKIIEGDPDEIDTKGYSDWDY